MKLKYFGHLMWRANSLEKTLILGKIEGRRRRGWQRMRWLDFIIDSMDLSLSKFQEIVKDKETWHAAVHGVTKGRRQLSDWTATTESPCCSQDKDQQHNCGLMPSKVWSLILPLTLSHIHGYFSLSSRTLIFSQESNILPPHRAFAHADPLPWLISTNLWNLEISTHATLFSEQAFPDIPQSNSPIFGFNIFVTVGIPHLFD